MRIERLILENVKCYSTLDMNFSDIEVPEGGLRNRTVVLGNNGTGKSTLLKSIALGLAGSSALGELIGDVDAWVQRGKDKGHIELHLKTSRNQDRKVRLALQRGDSLGDLIERNSESLELLDDAISHTERNYLVIGYGVHRRIGNPRFASSKGAFNSRRADNVATLFDSEASLYPFESWVMDLDYQGEEAKLRSLKRALNSLIPNAKFHSIDKKSKKVRFKSRDGLLNFDQMSDGFQITANWLGDLLFRISQTYSDYKNPLKARFILLIDEIALHLHPAWQRVIIQSIARLFPNAQLIATTHSPFVAQQAGNRELYTIIRNKKNHLDLFHYENDPRKLLIHQIIMSDIFGISSDESVAVEAAKNELRKNPELQQESIIQAPLKTNDQKGLNSLRDIKGVDRLTDLPLNTYSNENVLQNYTELVEKLRDEIKKIRDEES